MKLVFLDTETTSLLYSRRIWEVGFISRTEDNEQKEHQYFIGDVDLTDADLTSLKIGGFFDRHPQYRTGPERFKDYTWSEHEVARSLEMELRNSTVIGAVPSFDTNSLEDLFRRHHLRSSWHYHLMDVENLAVGYLKGRGMKGLLPPWKSDELTELMAVTPASPEERHTALGDARWAMRMWDKVYGNE